VPLEPEAAKILKPLAGKGPIIACCDNQSLYQEAGTSPGHENQIAGELSQEFVRDLCTHVPINRRSRKSNGGRRVNCEAVLCTDPGTWCRARLVPAKTLIPDCTICVDGGGVLGFFPSGGSKICM
jgi:hypothetical protein